ncbi:pilus assembly protein [Pseudomonas monsensis]|jgi:Flp pilus assembly protein TadG|uniref:Pilus assembly protein n=2 Tax=Pseudomonas TaxID=286 RepID=A0ABT3Z1T9_9PSED|nr:TadE/TadG family type IV pilus assembly protein [Pseudomonas monsensis]PTT81752.1 pilus assembly protein TadE [Pseudomonas sp. HMWF005]RON59703.1 pilus assembly protein TadE [Pseudomonas fluorescens]MCY0111741.1 pilus assembly protein [Pseudomonas monsensis]MDZ3827379.1 TadE/TadG family type IV pilus assembly protein [Pseudomonas monsensis]QXI01209.1 pilus assembly protein [Pseudomonas monsensis]
MKTNLPRKQKGAVAIEFALVFVVFFAVFYGLVSYSLPLLLMQSFNESTAETVRRSVALDPATANYPTALTTLARTELTRQLGWLPGALNFNAATDSSITYVGGLLTVSINYPTSKLNQALPFLVLPGIGTVPRLPATLRASSSLQF